MTSTLTVVQDLVVFMVVVDDNAAAAAAAVAVAGGVKIYRRQYYRQHYGTCSGDHTHPSSQQAAALLRLWRIYSRTWLVYIGGTRQTVVQTVLFLLMSVRPEYVEIIPINNIIRGPF